VQVQHGKANLRRALPGYNAAAQRSPWLVLVDLDQDFHCAAALVRDWLPTASTHMRFRIVVRQIESWLLADGERFSRFFGIRAGAVPDAPDTLPDAKVRMLELVATSRRKAVRQDMMPRQGSGRRVGPAYSSRLIDLVTDRQSGWRLDVAATRSPSLSKCLSRLDELIASAPR
jgi:hypothetical protein